MKLIYIAPLLMTLLAFPGFISAEEECDFDQAYLANYLIEVSARNPGGTVNLQEQEITWYPDDGAVVVVSHGGCFDLGTSIKQYYPPTSKPATEQAISDLLEVVSKYWSSQTSEDIAVILAKQMYTRDVLADGTVVFEVTPGQASAFPFGITIVVSNKDATIGWQEL